MLIGTNNQVIQGKEAPLTWPPPDQLVRGFFEPDERIQQLLMNLNRTDEEEAELRYCLKLDKENAYSRKQDARLNVFLQEADAMMPRNPLQDSFGEVLFAMIKLQGALPSEVNERMNTMRNRLANEICVLLGEIGALDETGNFRDS